METRLKRFLSLAIALLMVFSMMPQITLGASAASDSTFYFDPGVWNVDNPYFVAYVWNNSGNAWVDLTDSDGDGVYTGNLDASYTSMILLRKNPANAGHNWDGEWNRIGDMTIDGNKFTVTDWAKGTWSTYTPEVVEPETTTPETETPVVEKVTVYCVNSNKWATVSAYCWNDGGANTEWPGVAMTKTGDTVNGFDVYSVAVDKTYTSIIFNNNNQGSQTPDLAVNAGQYYDVKGSKWYASLNDIPAVDPLATDASLPGSFNDWNATNSQFMLTAEGATTATVTLTLEANKTYEFKVVNNGSWLSTSTAITGDASGLQFSSTVLENATITTADAGEYVFTYDLSANTLAVAYPAAEPEVPEPAEVQVETLEDLQAALADTTNDLPIVITQTIEIPEGETITIDLNGKTVTHVDAANKYAINNLGTLTLKDSKGNGSISARGIYNGYNAEGNHVATAKITVEGGTYNAKGTNGGAAIFNYGVVEIYGGTFTSVGSYSLNNQSGATMVIGDGIATADASSTGIVVSGGIYNTGATLTVNEGSISNSRSGAHTIYAWNSNVTINGGTIHNDNSGNSTIMAAGTSEVAIQNATVTLNIVDASSSYLLDAQNTASYTITGGNFTGGVRAQSGTSYTISGGNFTNEYGNYNVYDGGTVSVSGGTFSSDYAQAFATNNLTEGYELKEDGKVVEKTYPAYIGEQGYETLAAAITAANGMTDAVIEVYEDIDSLPVKMTAPMTVKGAVDGIEVNCAIAEYWNGVNGTVIFENLTFNNRISTEYGQPDSNSNMTLKFVDCKFNVSDTDNYAIQAGASWKNNNLGGLVIQGCEFKYVGSAFKGGYMIYAQCVTNVTITGNVIDGNNLYRGAIHLGDDTVYATVANVSDNTIKNFCRGVMLGNRVTGSQITIDGNTFDNINYNSLDSKAEAECAPIFIHDNASAETTSVVVTNNSVSNCRNPMIYSEDVDPVADYVSTFSGNTVAGEAVELENAYYAPNVSLTYDQFNEIIRTAEGGVYDGNNITVVLKDTERSYQNNKTAQFFIGATNVNITNPIDAVSVSNVNFVFEDDDTTNNYTSGELQVFANHIQFTNCTFDGVAVSPWGISNSENAQSAKFTDCVWQDLSGRYGVHQNRASELVVTGCEFNNCERGIHTNSSTVSSITITDNTFTGIGDGYGVLCLAESNGDLSKADLNITDNVAEGQVFLRQLSSTLTYEQAAEILDTTKNTYGTAYVAGSIEPVDPNAPVTYEVSTKDELDAAIAAAKDGDTILMTADIDYGTDHLEITKAITLDLGGKTLTTHARNYGLALKNDGITVTNGTLNHAGTVAAIKVWNAAEISNLEIDVTGTSSSGNTIDGIVIQENAAGVDTIKNVNIHSTSGQGIGSGIKTYNCGNAAEPVIGSMENVTINAVGTALNISAPCGTATNCSFTGGENGIEIWIKGTYSASLELVNSTVSGGVYAHDEFTSNPEAVNNGSLTLTVDEATTGASAEDITLTIARAENVEGVLEDVMTNAVAKIGDTYYLTLADALNAAAATEEDTVIQLLAGEFEMGSVKFPASMKNVTIKGAADKATVIKNSLWYSADGNSVVYEGITFDGIVFDNSQIVFTGARGGEVSYKDWTITNCEFKNIVSTSNSAIHFNLAADETMENLTFTNNVINGVSGGSISGLRANYLSGDITVTGNTISNVAWNAVQLIHVNADEFIIENNSFAADADEGLLNLYNTNATTLSIKNNKFLVTENQPGIAYLSSGNVSENYWGGNAPANLPEGVTFDSYYADADLTILVKFPTGTVTPAYTSADSFWGEGTSNAEESYVIKIYEGDKVIASASLNDVGNIIDGTTKNVTWHINFHENNDEYWTVEWTEGYPNINMAPTKVTLTVDDVEVATNNCQWNGPDNSNKIVALAEGFTGGVKAYTTLVDAMGNFNGRKVNVLCDVTESIESMKGATLTTNVEGGVTVTSTYNGYVYANDLSIGKGVTVKANKNFFYETDGVNTVEGTLEVADVFYHGYNAKTTVQNGGKIKVGGTTILRYNKNADAGLYIYGDGDDSTVEFDCDYYIGAYSGTFYAENANIETGYFLLKNSYDDSSYADIDMTLDNSSLTVVGTTDTQDSFIIDDQASLTLKNGSAIKDVRDFNILAGTNLTLSVDESSSISATYVNIADDVPLTYEKNEDGTVTIAPKSYEKDETTKVATIYNADGLKAFAAEVNGGNNFSGWTVNLVDDINLNNEEWTPIGKSSETPFNGTFNGNNHTISNLKISSGSTIGLFGRTNNGEIKNLTVHNATVTGVSSVGVVAGVPYTTKYTNIEVTGHVEVNGCWYVGGVGGKNAYADWTDITVDVDDTSYVKANSVSGDTAYRTYVGGVIGFNGEGGHTFKNITSNIDVIGSTCDIGGIFGIIHYNNKVENVTCSADVKSTGEADEIGGIAGVWHNEKGTSVNISNATYTGTVSDVNGEVENVDIVGAAYNASNETPSTSGSLIIDGEEAWLAVAKIGETKYATLAAAAEKAVSGDIIVLLDDVTLTETVSLPDGVTLNGNGKTVNGTITAGGDIVIADTISINAIATGNHSVTFTGNATITTGNVDIGGYATVNDEKVWHTNAKFIIASGASVDTTACAGFYGKHGATIIVEQGAILTTSGKFQNNGDMTVCGTLNVTNVDGDWLPKLAGTETVTSSLGGSFTVDGGSVSVDAGWLTFGGGQGSVWKDSTGKYDVTIKNGGKLTTTAAGFRNSVMSTLTIDNGTLEFTSSALTEWPTTTVVESAGAIVNNGEIILGDRTLNISGTLESSGDISGTIVAGENAEISIYAGTYTMDVKEWCALGYTTKDNGDGTWTVKAAVEAKIGNKPYATLAEAFAAAKEGDRILLQADAIVDEVLTVNHNITLADYDTYTVKFIGDGAIHITGSNNLNLDNVILTAPVYADSNTAGATIIDALAITGTSEHKSTVTSDGETVTVTNPEWVADVNGTVYYLTIDDAIKAAAAGDTVNIYAGEYNQSISVNKAITVVGETDENGNNLVSFKGQLSITADGAAAKNMNFNNGSGNGGYISAKDVLVEGCSVVGGNGFRYCYTSGTVTFKDSVITGSTYGIHFDGSAGGNIVIDNCVITGWTSFAGTIEKVTMKGTTFAEGNYNYIRFYQDEVVMEDCTFNDNMKVDIAVSGATVNVTNPTFNGEIENLFDAFDIDASDIYVDGVRLITPEASINGVEYDTFAEAIAAIGDGDVVIELITDVTLDYNAREAYGTDAITSVTINGNGHTVTLNQKDSDWSSIGLKNNAKLVLNNMTVEKTGYGDTSGAWNTHAIQFTCPVEMTDVVINNAIEVEAGATLNNVTINEANGYYGLWIVGNGQTVTVNGGAINATNGGRGIKIADQYVDAPAQVTLNVTGTKFTTAKKAAVLVSSTAGAKITANGADISGVAEDTVNFAWVDEDWAATSSTVTVNDEPAVLESKEEFIVTATSNGVLGHYKTLEAAVAAADSGTAVTLLTAYTMDATIVQSADKNIVIDGNGNTFSGTMFIDGDARAYGTDTLTIKNVKFVTSEKSRYFIDSNASYSGKNYNYAHNVTVEGCSFTATGDAVDTAVAMRIRQGFNINVVGCTATGLHSVLQGYGIAGVTVDNLTATDMKNGISLGTSTNATVKNSTIEATGYGIRTDATSASEVTVDGNTITAEKPVIVRKATADGYKLNVGTNTLTSTTDGAYQIIVTNGDDDEAVVNPTGDFKIEGDISSLNVYPNSLYVADINGRGYLSINDALTAAAAGDTVNIYAGEYNQSISVNKAITVVGETDAEGNNLVNFTGKLNITADGAAVKNINFNNGSSTAGYISAKDVLVEGCSVVGGNGFRYCYTTGTVTFKDSTITGSTYGIHFDGSAGGNIVIDNCVITGWTSFASTIEKVTMKDTTFAEGNYNYVRFYQDADMSGCTFNDNMKVDIAVSGATVNVTNPTFNGEIENLFNADDIDASDIYVDSVRLITPEASINGVEYDTFAEAIAAAKDGDEVKVVMAGTYKVPTGKNITVTGAVDGVKFDMASAVGVNASMTFNNVSFEYSTNGNYIGLQHAGTMVYNDCTINGQVFLYGTSETFNNCTFNQTSADAYNVWTYGAKEVAFNECTFNSAGKSVLIYSEQKDLVNDVTVTDCDFIASAPVDGKAAIEMDSSLTSGINLTIDAETTATGFGTGNVSGNSLWNNKKWDSTDANNDITVVVDEETVLAPVVFVAKIGKVGYTTLEDAIAAVENGGTIELLTDVEISETLYVNSNSAFDKITITINGNGHTIKAVGEGWTNEMHMVDIAWNVTLNNVTFDGNNTGCRGVQFYTSSSTLNNVTVKNISADLWSWTDYAIHANASDLTVTGTLTFENCKHGNLHLDIGSNLPEGTVSVVNTASATLKGAKIVLEGANTSATAKRLHVGYAAAELNGTYYGVLADAIALAQVDDQIVLMADAEKIELTKSINLDVNGKNVGEFVLTAADVTLTAEEDLNVTTAVEDHKVVYANGVYSVERKPNAEITYGIYGVETTGEAGTESYRERMAVDLYNVYAKESLVVELYSGETKLSTTTLRESDRDDENVKFYPYSGSITANIVIAGRLAGSWDTVWHVAPSVYSLPDSIKVYADGELVATWNGGFMNEEEAKNFGELPGVEKPFKLAGANVKLDDSLKMFFYVNYADLEGEDYYAEIRRTYNDGTADEVIKVPYSQWEHYNSNMIRIGYSGLSAKAMTDELCVTIYNGEDVVVSQVWEDSIKAYAMRQLNSTTDAKLQTVLVDLLNYGAAAQDYFDDYGINDLANADLTEEQKAYATQSVTPVDNRVKGTNYAGSSISLKSSIVLTMYFQNLTSELYANPSVDDLYAVVTYTDHYGKQEKLRVEGENFVVRGSMHGVDITGLAVADGKQLVTCVIYDADGNEIASAADSIESYIARMSGSVDPIYEMVMKFITSAIAHFG